MNVTTVPRQLRILQEGRSSEKKPLERKTTRGRRDDSRRDPMHALRMQRRLSNISYGQRARVKSSLEDITSFEHFDLLPVVKDGVKKQVLDGLDNTVPTSIQRLAIPMLLNPSRKGHQARRRAAAPKMQQYLLAAETGSGKTLAYLLPIIDGLKRSEASENQRAEDDARREVMEQTSLRRDRLFELPMPEITASSTDTARPRAVILLPTAELVSQVGAVVKALSHTVKYRTAVISAAVSPTVIRNRLFSSGGVDIVISTPHLLSSIAETDPNVLSQVEYLVIDEADSLLDRSFMPITSSIIDRATPSLTKLILCSATIPRSLEAYLSKRYPDTQRLATPNLHAVPRRVQLSVVDIDKIPYQGNRQLACAQIIWDIGKESTDADEGRERRVMVFVNERKTVTTLTQYLKTKGIDAHEFSRDAEQRENGDALSSFVSTPTSRKKIVESATEDLPGASEGSTSSRVLPNTKVLVTTDIASRGIDTTPVKHVVLYDVPHTSIDFIHRLGRVGRMGRRGRGIVLVDRHDRKDVVKEVREGMYRGAALI